MIWQVCYLIVQSLKKVENEIAIKYGVDEMLLDSECCKKTFLKAVYVCVGKFYHNVDESQNSTGYNLEFNFKDYAIADDVKALLGYFELQFKMNSRKNITTLYTKNSETINNFFCIDRCCFMFFRVPKQSNFS